MKREILSVLVGAFIAVAAFSQHDDHHDEKHHDDKHADQHHTDHHFHKHHLALFTGGATNFSHHETKPGLGLDYEYRLANIIGLGLVAEVEFTEKESFLFSVPVFYHPVKGLKIYLGPALFSTVEHHEEKTNDTHGTHEVHEPARSTHFGGRLGAAYDFHIGKVSIGPSLNYAFGKTNALIYGINLGLGF
jgi:hypothetical protein